jgi:hypothetical protein
MSLIFIVSSSLRIMADHARERRVAIEDAAVHPDGVKPLERRLQGELHP